MSTAVPESRYPWMIVAIGGLMACVAIGTMFSLAIFLQPIARRPAGRGPVSRRR